MRTLFSPLARPGCGCRARCAVRVGCIAAWVWVLASALTPFGMLYTSVALSVSRAVPQLPGLAYAYSPLGGPFVWISLVLGVCGVMRRASCVLAAVVRAVWTSGCVTSLICVHARCRRHPPFTLLHTMALFMLCIGARGSGHAPRAVRVAPP